MSHLDAIFLARLQFAFTLGFHIVFPAFSIGLASYLAVLEGLWLRAGTKRHSQGRRRSPNAREPNSRDF